MAKKSEERTERELVAAQIRKTPTASDAQVGAVVDVAREVVTDVRGEMGAKDTWPKPKEEKSK